MRKIIKVLLVTAVLLAMTALTVSAIDTSHWAIDYVDFCLNNMIIDGYRSSFPVNEEIPRKRVALAIVRIEEALYTNYETSPFDDVYYGDNYTGPINWVYSEGIMNGHSDGLFHPDDPIRRQDMALVIHRYLTDCCGIDLPVESLGYSGSSKLPGHLLDFSIGQYDTYTPIQIVQYINTLANDGIKLQPYLLKEVYEAPDDNNNKFGEKVFVNETVNMGKVDVEAKYMDRVKEGFRAVVSYGLGYGYMGKYNDIGAGKTGTSQSFIDTDGDGTVDTETITTSFVGYAPYKDPKMSIVVISPDVAEANTDTTSAINKRLSSKIVNKYFEIYK